ncbi:hypothetical protein BZG36_02564, partial [Bifiguratus adelaidae]
MAPHLVARQNPALAGDSGGPVSEGFFRQHNVRRQWIAFGVLWCLLAAALAWRYLFGDGRDGSRHATGPTTGAATGPSMVESGRTPGIDEPTTAGTTAGTGTGYNATTGENVGAGGTTGTGNRIGIAGSKMAGAGGVAGAVTRASDRVYRLLRDATLLLLPALLINGLGNGSTLAVEILTWIFLGLTIIFVFLEVFMDVRVLRFVKMAILAAIAFVILCEYPEAPPNLSDLARQVVILHETLHSLENRFIVVERRNALGHALDNTSPRSEASPYAPSTPIKLEEENLQQGSKLIGRIELPNDAKIICTACAEASAECDMETPCGRCQTLEIKCVYQQQTRSQELAIAVGRLNDALDQLSKRTSDFPDSGTVGEAMTREDVPMQGEDHMVNERGSKSASPKASEVEEDDADLDLPPDASWALAYTGSGLRIDARVRSLGDMKALVEELEQMYIGKAGGDDPVPVEDQLTGQEGFAATTWVHLANNALWGEALGYLGSIFDTNALPSLAGTDEDDTQTTLTGDQRDDIDDALLSTLLLQVDDYCKNRDLQLATEDFLFPVESVQQALAIFYQVPPKYNPRSRLIPSSPTSFRSVAHQFTFHCLLTYVQYMNPPTTTDFSSLSSKLIAISRNLLQRLISLMGEEELGADEYHAISLGLTLLAWIDWNRGQYARFGQMASLAIRLSPFWAACIAIEAPDHKPSPSKSSNTTSANHSKKRKTTNSIKRVQRQGKRVASDQLDANRTWTALQYLNSVMMVWLGHPSFFPMLTLANDSEFFLSIHTLKLSPDANHVDNYELLRNIIGRFTTSCILQGLYGRRCRSLPLEIFSDMDNFLERWYAAIPDDLRLVNHPPKPHDTASSLHSPYLYANLLQLWFHRARILVYYPTLDMMLSSAIEESSDGATVVAAEALMLDGLQDVQITGFQICLTELEELLGAFINLLDQSLPASVYGETLMQVYWTAILTIVRLRDIEEADNGEEDEASEDEGLVLEPKRQGVVDIKPETMEDRDVEPEETLSDLASLARGFVHIGLSISKECFSETVSSMKGNQTIWKALVDKTCKVFYVADLLEV